MHRTVAAIALVVFLFGCTTTRTIDVRGLSGPSGLTEVVEPGDRVVVTTRDGRELKFKVVAVERDALVGASERVERDEIAEVQIKRPDDLRTAGAIGGGTVAFLIVMGVLAAAVLPAAILSAS